jgi:hypothetical protein
MSGTVNYASTQSLGPNGSAGTVSGTIVADFDGIGQVRVPFQGVTVGQLINQANLTTS